MRRSVHFRNADPLATSAMSACIRTARTGAPRVARRALNVLVLWAGTILPHASSGGASGIGFARITPIAAQRITPVAVAPAAFAPHVVASAEDSLTRLYTVEGLQVIHRRAANDIVAANLYLLGGTRQVTETTAGIEPLLLAASERGTARFSREALRRTMARTGSSIVIDADRDWTVIGFRATLDGWRDTWAVWADRIVAPVLEPAEVAQVRELTLAALAQRRDSPDQWLEHLADSVAFSAHPYGIDPDGTERSVGALSAETLRAYHQAQFVKSRMLLVVVGNVAPRVLDSLITTTLGRLPTGAYHWEMPDTIPRRPATVHREARPLPTNYLLGYAPGPLAGNPDYDALRIASAILSGQLFAEVRSRQTLTYAVHAPFVERAVSAVGLYVSTTDPVAALNAMRGEIRSLQEMRIDGRSLAPLVQQFITEYFLNNETNAAQAAFLARSQLYRGDWRRGLEFSDALRAVTPADIQRVMRTYFRDIIFAYVGDPSRLPDSAVRGF
jgi:zinc protease